MNPFSFFRRGGTTPNDPKPVNDPAAGLPFAKMQSVGNDFVVLDESAWPADSDWPKLAIRLCERRFGIGGDGLLLIGQSDKADLRMRMFNPDGTEDMCGNGLRCVVHLAHKRGRIASSSRIETLSGIHLVDVLDDSRISADMGAPKFAPVDIPMAGDSSTNVNVHAFAGDVRVLDCVNTGSTHSVLWKDLLPADDEFFSWSALIETHRLFPQRTSVLWAVVTSLPEIKDKPNMSSIAMRIWERGAGETLGCGTGACAVAVLAKRQNKVPLDHNWIGVTTKGGDLLVYWSGGEQDTMVLIGKAHLLYEGVWCGEGDKTDASH